MTKEKNRVSPHPANLCGGERIKVRGGISGALAPEVCSLRLIRMRKKIKT